MSNLSKSSDKKSLATFLKKYPVKFKKPLDDIWAECDTDNNGYLDKNETPKFLDEVTKVMDSPKRLENYDKNNFD
mgnify:CR=1 FL=1|jgi:hypothetical protein